MRSPPQAPGLRARARAAKPPPRACASRARSALSACEAIWLRQSESGEATSEELAARQEREGCAPPSDQTARSTREQRPPEATAVREGARGRQEREVRRPRPSAEDDDQTRAQLESSEATSEELAAVKSEKDALSAEATRLRAQLESSEATSEELAVVKSEKDGLSAEAARLRAGRFNAESSGAELSALKSQLPGSRWWRSRRHGATDRDEALAKATSALIACGRSAMAKVENDELSAENGDARAQAKSARCENCRESRRRNQGTTCGGPRTSRSRIRCDALPKFTLGEFDEAARHDFASGAASARCRSSAVTVVSARAGSLIVDARVTVADPARRRAMASGVSQTRRLRLSTPSASGHVRFPACKSVVKGNPWKPRRRSRARPSEATTQIDKMTDLSDTEGSFIARRFVRAWTTPETEACEQKRKEEVSMAELQAKRQSHRQQFMSSLPEPPQQASRVSSRCCGRDRCIDRRARIQTADSS